MGIIYHDLWLQFYAVVCASFTSLILNVMNYVKAKQLSVLKLTEMTTGSDGGRKDGAAPREDRGRGAGPCAASRPGWGAAGDMPLGRAPPDQ